MPKIVKIGGCVYNILCIQVIASQTWNIFETQCS